MLSLLLTLVVGFVVFVLAWWVVHRIAKAFEAPPQVLVIAEVLLVCLGVFFLLNAFGLLNRFWP